MITKACLLEYLELQQELKYKERPICNRVNEVALAVAEIRGNIVRSWDEVLDISALDSTTVIINVLDCCDRDVLSSFEFPTEYLWLPNWKDIEKKKEQERKLAEEQERADRMAMAERRKEEEEEYALFLKLKEKFGDKKRKNW